MTVRNAKRSIQQVQVKRIERYLMTHVEELTKKYGTPNIGIGFKTKGDKPTKEIAIIFFVKKKKSAKKLKEEGIEPVPQYIDGIPTDIVEAPEGFMLG